MMNKFLIALAVAFVAFQATPVFAQEAPVATTTVIIQNGDPNLVMQVWGLTGAQTPRFGVGESVTDESGYTDVCPLWYPKMGCANISKTDYYRNSHIEVARQLIAKGTLSRFPAWITYWAKFVK